jgi:hypothetical protein
MTFYHTMLPVIHIAWSMEKYEYKHAQVSQERRIFDSACCRNRCSAVVVHHSKRSASVSILYVAKKSRINQRIYIEHNTVQTLRGIRLRADAALPWLA